MQSLVLTADGLQISDTPIPPLMPGDVRIEVRSVGLCGTDLAIWKGDYHAELPLILVLFMRALYLRSSLVLL